MRFFRPLASTLTAMAVLGALAMPAQAVENPYPSQSGSWTDVTASSPTLAAPTTVVSALTNTNMFGSASAGEANSVLKASVKVDYQIKVSDYGYVTRTRQETRTRQVDVWGWKQVGYGKAVDANGAQMRYSERLDRILWAGNDTSSNGYGAHNQLYADGTTTHGLRDTFCSNFLLYTPGYAQGVSDSRIKDRSELQTGFYTDAARNPFNSHSSPTYYARVGIYGGDPLMRWNGASGFGWYYKCYAITSERWEVVDQSTETYTVTVSYQNWEKIGEHYESTAPTTSGAENRSSLIVTCQTSADPNYVVATLPSSPYSTRMRLVTTATQASSAADSWSNVVSVQNSSGTSILSATVPAECYGSAGTGGTSGTGSIILPSTKVRPS